MSHRAKGGRCPEGDIVVTPGCERGRGKPVSMALGLQKKKRDEVSYQTWGETTWRGSLRNL